MTETRYPNDSKTFVLRLWSEQEEGRRAWRFSLEDPLTRGRRGFGSLGEIGDFLASLCKTEGPERRVFREHVRLDPIDAQTNGPQLFYGLRYHIHINTPEEDITFHDQVGYWLWEPATGLVMQTVAIPRGQVLLAAGHAGVDDSKISVTAKRGDTRYGICSTEFLDEAFRTDSYQLDIEFHDDGSWSYVSDTTLVVKGQPEPFLHRDHNHLRKVAEPDLNPWLRIVKGQQPG